MAVTAEAAHSARQTIMELAGSAESEEDRTALDAAAAVLYRMVNQLATDELKTI